MSRLIIISNRLPFSIGKTGEDITVRQSSGGLVSAIKSYFEARNSESEAYSEKIWVGSMDTEKEHWKKATEKGLLQADFTIVPIFPEKHLYDRYYNGFANSTLLPSITCREVLAVSCNRLLRNSLERLKPSSG